MTRASITKLGVTIAVALAFLIFVNGEAASSATVVPPSGASEFEIQLPRGIPQDLWAYFIPTDNPMTQPKVELGRKLFFDPRLSADGKISCATCHDPKLAFTDGKRVAEGIAGRLGTRNSPSLLNSMFNTGQFWDGRAATLEEQAILPLTNPDEMGNESLDQVMARIGGISEYSTAFDRVFGARVSSDRVAKAIAAYERTLISGDSPMDRYIAGETDAISESAKRGLGLFRGRARCGICHAFNLNFGTGPSFPFLTDGNYRNTGVAANFSGFAELARRAMAASRDQTGRATAELAGHQAASRLGRFVISGNTLDIGAFRTPSLRNLGLTAPYFHDGSAATLEDVVKFYVKGGNNNPNRDWQLEPVPLSDSEQADLVEFLKTLTSEDARRSPESN